MFLLTDKLSHIRFDRTVGPKLRGPRFFVPMLLRLHYQKTVGASPWAGFSVAAATGEPNRYPCLPQGHHSSSHHSHSWAGYGATENDKLCTKEQYLRKKKICDSNYA